MNRHAHRLVFDALRGMRVAAPEFARSAGKAARGEGCASLVSAALVLALAPGLSAAQKRPPVVFASKLPAPVHNLPRPYGTSAVRQANGTFAVRTDKSFVANPLQASQIKWTVEGNTGTLDQGNVERVILNWDSFDIGAGYKVHFKQDKDPSKYVSALNRIWSLDPSVILGSLTADREVILLNANGVYFGRGARVDTGKFVATTLGIADSVFEKGLRNVKDGSAVFSTAGTDYMPTNLDGAVSVEAGAEIRSAAGGDVLLIAPRVVNQGRIETPKGQTVLAAGDKVYLMSSSDPAQRGLIVAVDPIKVVRTVVDPVTGESREEQVVDKELGIAENAARGAFKTVEGQTVEDNTPDTTSGLVQRINEIAAESGTINLVGLTVRQAGNLRATTAVKGANGAIYLQAQASTTELTAGAAAEARGYKIDDGAKVTVAERLGTLEVATGSRTAVTPERDTGKTQLDSETFNRSVVRLEGASIHVGADARIEAPSGRIDILAAQNAQESVLFKADYNAVAPVPDASRVVIDPNARVDASGLRDVAIDGARNQGDLRLFRIELADAPVQRDGPLYRSQVFFDLRNAGSIKAANVTGAANAIARSAQELSASGGAIRIESEGALVVGDGAQIDVSGGSLSYTPTTLKSSVLNDDGRLAVFDNAAGNRRYEGVASAVVQRTVPAYQEGKDGGSLAVTGRLGHFGGAVQASVVQGEYQRDGRSTAAAPSSMTFGRAVGDNHYLAGITLGNSAAPDAAQAVLAAPFDAPLDGLGGTFALSLARLQDTRGGKLQLRAGTVRSDGFAEIDLGPRGALDIQAQRIDLDAAVHASGGTIRLATSAGGSGDGAGNIQLSSNSKLDTAGLWTNDTQAGGGAARVQTSGGTVVVSAAHSAQLASGAVIDVSGGARLQSDGKLSTGKAGSVSVSVGNALPVEQRAAARLELGADLRGFDFAIGGTLNLGVTDLQIGGPPSDAFRLSTEFFQSGGFGSIAVSSFGDVRFGADLRLTPQLRNWQLAPQARSMASGSMRAEVATPQRLDEQLVDRAPVSLSFAATAPINQALGLQGGDVVVERGAQIALEGGAALALQATRNVTVGAIGDGSAATVLSAPGGTVTLRTTGPRGATENSPQDDPAGFVANQSIWIATGSTVSVAGAAEVRPDRSGPILAQFVPDGSAGVLSASRLVGTVRGGGTINLEANRGYVVTEQGSTLNLDGIAQQVNAPGSLIAQQVAKPAGTLNVRTPEGFVLDGAVSARAPRAASGERLADGGRLNLALGVVSGLGGDLGGVSVYTAAVANPYPDAAANPRQIVVADHADVLGSRDAKFGDDLNAKLGNGIGHAPKAVLEGSGFDAITLAAGDKLAFAGDAQLRGGLSVALHAPVIEGASGVKVTVSAPYVSIGDPTVGRTSGAAPADPSAAFAAPSEARTELQVDAQTIDVNGRSGLRGFDRVTLDATRRRDGEIRLLSYVPGIADAGALNVAGELSLAAGQVYASSGSRFVIDGIAETGDAARGSTVRFARPAQGSTSTTPLSVFGSLTVQAAEIEQGGVLRQPFGRIDLNASRRLTLGDGSLTSVSADGAILPFGTTTNLSQWFTAGRAEELAALPLDKRISLRAPELVTRTTARVDARGGGDIQAHEFFPGVGGSTDYFDTAGLFAIVPDYSASHAPRGEDFGSANASRSGAQFVVTMTGSGLAPGRYTVMPARYALLAGSLPAGAFLVRRADDQGKTVLSAPMRNDDGSVVITGYVTQAGSTTVGTPGERFVVESEATFRRKSEIRLTRISDFFQARALSQGEATPIAPRDAGLVQVSTGSSGALAGSFQLAAPRGARAGQLDIAAPKIALVDAAADTPEGHLGVSADTLVASQAGSVLLGGTRSVVADPNAATPRVAVDTSRTTDVLVKARRAPVQAEELILAAGNKVELESGVALQAGASGSQGARRIELAGDSALLVTSANPLDVQRSGVAGAAGDILAGSGVALQGRTVAVDATAKLQLPDDTRLSAGQLALAARQIAIGGSNADPLATVLGGALLTSVQRADDLTLRSYSSIDFVGAQDWARRPTSDTGAPPGNVLRSLTLDTPAVRGVDGVSTDGQVVPARIDIAAQSLTLRNSSGSAPTAAPGSGTLLLESRPPLQYGTTGGMTIGPGGVSLNVASAELRSSGDIVLTGSGELRAQADLGLQSVRVTATADAQHKVQAADGTLRIGRVAEGHSLNERVGQGASVRLEGRTIEHDGWIDLPGGWLTLQASGTTPDATTIRFAPGSLTSVAGYSVDRGTGAPIDGRAGQVSASAAQGRIDLLGRIDVSAARRADGAMGIGDAGRIELSASGAGGRLNLQDAGQLVGNRGSAASDRGGRLAIDVQSLQSEDATAAGALDRVARVAQAGGLRGEFDVRVRSGDVTLDTSVQAERIAIAADSGNLTIGRATLGADARPGGVVQLAAAGDVVLGAASTISARSTAAGANGGDVLLSSSAGRLRLNTDARIDAGGDDIQDGRIVLRAQRGADGASVQIDPLTTRNLQAGEVDIEAVKVYRTVTVGAVTRDIAAIGAGTSALTGSGANQTGTLGQASVRADSTAFMANGTAALASLGVDPSESGRVRLRAGVEVAASGNLTVNTDWALNAERPGGDAGFLTLRAAGNLALNGSLSDGFAGATALAPLSVDPRAWSYRLAGGADLGAANVLATRDLAEAALDSGNVSLAAGKLVRTGAGSIEITAGRDMRLGGTGTSTSVVYVAGRQHESANAVLATLFEGQAAKPTFTEHGGRLQIDARRDVVAPVPNQLINNWFWRSGLASSSADEADLYAGSSQLAWWSEFSRYQQGIASFGGGSIDVRAGRDLSNLSVMAPTSAWADSRSRSGAQVVVNNGGDVSVQAGRDVVGGQYFVGRGEGRIVAGGALSDAATGALKSPALALMDGRWDVSARANLNVDGAFNPTAVAVSAQDGRTNVSGLFYTYGPDASVALQSASGDVAITGSANRSLSGYRLDGSTLAPPLFNVMPASLSMHAFGGDALAFPRSVGAALLFPSARGQFDVYAKGDFELGAPGSPGRIAMGDMDRSLLPDVRSPLNNQQANAALGNRSSGLIELALSNGGATAVGDSLPHVGLHAGDAQPARIHADGSIRMSDSSSLNMAKATQISAGRDIFGLRFIGLNLDAGDATAVEAGRNYAAGTGGVVVAGPGALTVTAGRQLDLGVSLGISTIGNLTWAGGPAQGASVKVGAGTIGTLDSAAFDAGYLQPGSTQWEQNRQALLAFVRDALKSPAIDYDSAWSQFQRFPAAEQARFARGVLNAAFGAAYLAAAPTAAAFAADLRATFERHRNTVLEAGAAALAAGQTITLPGNEVLGGDALRRYLDGLRALSYESLDLKSTLDARLATLQRHADGWRSVVATQMGSTVAELQMREQQDANDPLVQRYRSALSTYSGATFERYRDSVLAQEIAGSGEAASNFGLRSLPMRMALYDQGFRVAELSGLGNFESRPIWSGAVRTLDFSGTMNLTQSSIVTRRGGDITLLNPGGPINVGLKDSGTKTSDVTGVIALGGGDVFGYAKNDFQVNNQRVFIVGKGDMTVWSSAGDIDSGRGANTAVGTPPLTARRSADGVVFEVPPTTTGSGLAILGDAEGKREGAIGLYPAFGEILALDAFIRAPVVRLGSSTRGADNVQAPTISGAAAVVAAPNFSASLSNLSPTAAGPEPGAASTASERERQRSSLLTVELLGLGGDAKKDDDKPEDCERQGMSDAERDRCRAAARTRGERR